MTPPVQSKEPDDTVTGVESVGPCVQSSGLQDQVPEVLTEERSTNAEGSETETGVPQKGHTQETGGSPWGRDLNPGCGWVTRESKWSM